MGTRSEQLCPAKLHPRKYCARDAELLVLQRGLWYGIEKSLLSLFLQHSSLAVIHKMSFVMFLIMSLTHMVLAYLVMKHYRSISRDSIDAKSLKWKFRMMISNVTSILSACYFFYRHNEYCEPFGNYYLIDSNKFSSHLFAVYSMFALAEYLVVVTNMGFHLTATLDFAGRSILISSSGVRII